MLLGRKRFHFARRLLALAAAALSLASIRVIAAASLPGVEHVVIIGVDGMSTEGVEKATAPNMHQFMRDGAYTLHARGVMPTVSSPNWASMIMGAGPEQHGVTSNDWQPDEYEITPVCRGSAGIFPTIFGVLREERSSSIIACFTDWDGFVRLVEPKAPDVIEYVEGVDNTTAHAIACLQRKKPTFTFIHYDSVDHAGHTYGWGTTEYYEAVAQVDQLIGKVTEAIKQAGMFGRTIILVTADHGGQGKKHGGNTMQELEIPWIIFGPDVSPGKEITSPVNTYDTAATVAYIFGLTPPNCWIGRPVLEAFKSLQAATGADVPSKR